MTRALSGRDLLSIADLDRDEINMVLDLAMRAKAGEDLGSPLRGLNLALIFQRPSNRTRVSFEVAINRLGGHPIALFGDEIRLGERETASGEEITDGVLDDPRSIVFDQAENRLWAQTALLALVFEGAAQRSPRVAAVRS